MHSRLFVSPINPNLPEEILDITCNFAMMGFQCKMAAVNVFHNRIRQVSLEGFGSRWNEGRIVLPPHGEKARLMLPLKYF